MSDHDSADQPKKPTASSVTDQPCTCGSLQRAAEEPSNPIVFDATMNEYRLKHFDLEGTGQHGYGVIYHSVFCGGAAPRSQRGTFFVQITTAETRRLKALASGLRTVEDAIAKLGKPDEDHPTGMTTQSPATDTEPSIVRSYRLLRYTRLSETANVMFVDYGPERGLSMTLESKYIGPPRSSP